MFSSSQLFAAILCMLLQGCPPASAACRNRVDPFLDHGKNLHLPGGLLRPAAKLWRAEGVVNQLVLRISPFGCRQSFISTPTFLRSSSRTKPKLGQMNGTLLPQQPYLRAGTTRDFLLNLHQVVRTASCQATGSITCITGRSIPARSTMACPPDHISDQTSCQSAISVRIDAPQNSCVPGWRFSSASLKGVESWGKLCSSLVGWWLGLRFVDR